MPSARVTWTSEDPATATVDDRGMVTAVANGAATITAAVGNVQAMSAFAIGNPDRAALVALYGATDGPNWTSNENWLTDAPLGEWYGVDTDASGRVVKLELNSQLFGTVPAALGYLAALEHLDLGNNVWTGPIPSQLGNLTALKFLDLSTALEAVDLGWGLTDTIPAELGNLAALEHLDLANNQLVGPDPPGARQSHQSYAARPPRQLSFRPDSPGASRSHKSRNPAPCRERSFRPDPRGARWSHKPDSAVSWLQWPF